MAKKFLPPPPPNPKFVPTALIQIPFIRMTFHGTDSYLRPKSRLPI